MSEQYDENDGQKPFWERLFSNGEEDVPAEAEGAEAHNPLQALRDMRVEDVAVPKADIVAIPEAATADELLEKFREGGFSRMPVYRESLDTPIGMIHLKDIVLRYGFDGLDEFDMAAIMRPLLYVPPSMPVATLMQKMQSDRMHMALVIDEYGGVDGLATMEDLIEEVVGEIDDEHDEAEAAGWTQEAEGVWIAQARTSLDEFEEATGLNLREDVDDDEVDTLGGLVFRLAGSVPARGEVVRMEEGPEFEVVDADPRRIKRLRVRLRQRNAAPAENS
ncbi:hemolysin family protein [Paracoccaceae bacterium GXU_MW_L88]